MTDIPGIYDKDPDFRIRVIERMKALGSVIAAGSATAAASTTSTAVTVGACRAADSVLISPNDTDAASAMAWVSAVADGSFTLSHSSEGSAREFTYVVIAGPGGR